MAHTIHRSFATRVGLSVLAGTFIGAFLGFASAQETASGWLNTDCVQRCASNGYDAKFCSEVCWVPDPAKDAEAEQLDWKCIGDCTQRGGKSRACMASCRRY